MYLELPGFHPTAKNSSRTRAAKKNLADRLELIFSCEIKAFGSDLLDKKWFSGAVQEVATESLNIAV